MQIEGHLEDDDDYEAMCDITATMSCTAVFKSSYAHLFSHWGLVPKGHPLDLSLAIIGVALYGAYFVAGCLWHALPAGFRSQLFLTVAAGGGCFSCYLLYVLKFILKDFCIVCTGFHCVNFSMLALAILEYWSYVKNRADMASVPAQPKRLIGRGWPKLGAAWSTIWR